MQQERALQSRIRILARQIYESRYPVFFTGAGISTESGISDYRGPDGVWTRQEKGLPPDPRSLPLDQAEPNTGHMSLKELQDLGKLAYLITQNVDNLHLRSGIRPEILAELHGNVALLRCENCGRKAPRNMGLTSCQCGGHLTSSVVNFGDPLPRQELQESFAQAQKADLFMVLGSSLTVRPAADLPLEAARNNAYLVIVNKQNTPLDSMASLRFSEPIGQVLPAIVKRLKGHMGLFD
ncbi:MAG: SIR2 family NAD-dependent protein deacylase [Desulfohalobiaceae bacterium]